MKRQSCFKAIAFLLSLFPLPECIQSIIRLSVEVPPAISQECYGEVLDEFSKKAKVPGFRQGKKVPENILLNYIGRQNIQQAVVEATLKKTLPHAMSSVREHSISLPTCSRRQSFIHPIL
ncbi:trigger factor-like protein TIG, Chloroplastic [Zingiber officinale]|uniref:trigger factor-like protein TIG, Chloroplastic n=1 Tax=Zingiber officinale TaxID=94328 RepID=UPI001C4CB4DA|nr:trigger factor-like protein TIG, Chloroplastic [Zingiber officinale]